MKSFDEMADDFVLQEVRRSLPYVLRKHELTYLRSGYMAGLNAGIEFCADTIEPIEEKGL